MKTIVSIHEAKTQLSKLIQLALAGEEVIIAKRHEPLVKLQVIRDAQPARSFGGLRQLVIAMDDHFDDELPDFEEYAPAAPIQQISEEPGDYRA